MQRPRSLLGDPAGMTSAVTVPPPQRSGRASIRVVVMSDLFLLGDAVRMALQGGGFEVTSMRMPLGRGQLRQLEHDLRRFRPSVGLMLMQVDDPIRLREAAELVSRGRTGWLLLTDSTAEASWGAAVSAGAVGVLPMSVGLDELSRAVVAVAAGRAVMADSTRSRLLRAWHEVTEEQSRLARQMEMLTPRELAVLALLHDGLPVRQIAEEAGVSEGTVRSQVKAILRKLQVRSQLAAVAAYRQVAERRIRSLRHGS